MSDYEIYQAAKDREYTEAWEQHLETLSPEERKAFEELGVITVEKPVYHTAKRDEEAILTKTAAASDVLDKPQTTQPADIQADALWSALRKVIGELLGQTNPKLTLECLALVSGIAYEGDSMTAIAKRHGLTRAAVSKRCVEITNALNLPPSRAMRKLTARQAYRQAQIKISEHHEQFNNRHSKQS